ncbi:MAG: AAA family ATPase [Betaproteobacteria bacterium]|nr:AAA family ATPase [Betaproteobacteria bacterium]
MPHDGHNHDKGGHEHKHAHPRQRFKATVDHLSNDYATASRLLIALDTGLMHRHGLQPDDIVRVATERGRSVLARLDTPPPEHDERGVVRMDRFLRQALKAHLNETVEIEPVDAKPAARVELTPAIDVSTAHDLLPHLKKVMAENRTPLSVGAVLYISFPGTQAGTTYEVHQVPDGAGYATDATEVRLHFHDAHIPEGAFDVTFEDVGGLGRQIKLVRELVQLPLKFPHVYRQLGINPPRGIILYGPPGSGKTHLARAVANEIEARFYTINGPEIIGTFAGETEGNLRRLFAEAAHHAPSIVFIDELDALAPKRGETGAHSDVRAVTQLLSLMDGLTRVDSVIVIGTTNRIDSVDLAFRRPGRFDREIFVGPPDAQGRREILEIQTREMPLTDDAQICMDEVARRTHGFVGADLMELCRCAGLSALRRSTLNLENPKAAFRVDMTNLRVDRQDFETAMSQVRPSAMRETLISIPDVSWGDIGGLDSVKDRLKELMEQPLRNPQLLASMGLTPHVGALLYGPPGTGKTLLAKALANECGVNFISVDGPEIFSKWLGESEEGVRQIFRIARQVAPTVVFFDQLDSITPVRGAHEGSMTTERVVNQLLAELDGVEQLSGVIVIGATNRIDLVDPSILRPGRFGVHIAVPLPEETERRSIVRIHLGGKLIEETNENATRLDAIAGEIAARTAGFSGARLRQVCQDAKRLALRENGFVRAVAPSLLHALLALEAELNEPGQRGTTASSSGATTSSSDATASSSDATASSSDATASQADATAT